VELPNNEVGEGPAVVPQHANVNSDNERNGDSGESDGSGNNESSASEVESDMDGDPNGSTDSDDSENEFDDDGDDKLFNDSPVRLSEFMLAILTVFMRHRLTGKCLSDLSLIAMICPPRQPLCQNPLYV